MIRGRNRLIIKTHQQDPRENIIRMFCYSIDRRPRCLNEYYFSNVIRLVTVSSDVIKR